MSSSENTSFDLFKPWLGVGRPTSYTWEPISMQQSLLILVGVTGVGKTTTVEALRHAGLSFVLLPNRRELTNKLMITWVQDHKNVPRMPVKDRTERFAHTAYYRQHFPGGMAHTLARLWVNPETMNVSYMIFDGLRGENEIHHAVKLLPQARFIFLHAPHFVRIQRLLNRQDKFDAISRTSKLENKGSQLKRLAELGVGELEGLLSAEEEQTLLTLVQQGQVSLEDLQAKLSIVLAERNNYDPDATKETLLRLAPERTFFVDTTQYGPDEVAQLILNIENQNFRF